MRLPQSFKLFGHSIKVRLVNNIKLKRDGIQLLGYTDSDFNRIVITKNLKESNGKLKKIPQSQIEHTFYHELVHMILIKMGESKLSKDEKFVDSFAGFLQQYMRTKKYSK